MLLFFILLTASPVDASSENDPEPRCKLGEAQYENSSVLLIVYSEEFVVLVVQKILEL